MINDQRHHSTTTVLVTGGTGFIGQPLCRLLKGLGYRLIVLTRQRDITAKQHGSDTAFIGSLDEIDGNENINVIINLAGEPLSKQRWSAPFKEQLINSRVAMTRSIARLVARLERAPQLLINGSAIGFYGPCDDTVLGEKSQFTESFSHRLCAAWEQEANQMRRVSRLCIIRIGVVLGNGGGPFSELRRPFDMKVASYFGSGAQWMSWIHLQDLLAIILFLINNQKLNGVFNATAPQPVTNKAFSLRLARIKKCWIKLKIPSFLLKLMLGEMAPELLLSGQRVMPVRLCDEGYQFLFPQLDDTLNDLLNQPIS